MKYGKNNLLCILNSAEHIFSFKIIHIIVQHSVFGRINTLLLTVTTKQKFRSNTFGHSDFIEILYFYPILAWEPSYKATYRRRHCYNVLIITASITL